MGKKGSWFSAIKRVFTPHSKEKLANDSEKKSKKEKKKGIGKLRHGESNSFIPLFREPSSVEKIFWDFEREQQQISYRSSTPTPPPEHPITPPIVPPRDPSPRDPSPRAPSPRAVSPRGVSSTVSPPRVASPRIASSPRASASRTVRHHRPEPTVRNHHASATKIQATYRGYMARKSFRALKGLVRLQGVVRGQNVKRQTMNAMKQMQLLVRVQSQIQSRRIQMLENQARGQPQYMNDKETESAMGKWNLSQSEAGEDWDDSVLTKEQVDARLQRKVDAVIKRERAMAYAYSNQLWKATPKSAQTALSDIRSDRFPWWWNWIERQQQRLPSNPPENQTLKSFLLAPPTPQTEQRRTPRFQSQNNRQTHFGIYNMDTPTPKSTRSTILTNTKAARTPPPPLRTPQANTSCFSRYSESPFDMPLKDDDSLISCPPFSVPHYMAPTVSAKAKARASSNPKERLPETPSSESKRRLSFPLTQGISSFKWNRGSLFSAKDSSSQRILDKNQSLQSIGNLSVDSTVSLPAGVGRKPFNRFV